MDYVSSYSSRSGSSSCNLLVNHLIRSLDWFFDIFIFEIAPSTKDCIGTDDSGFVFLIFLLENILNLSWCDDVTSKEWINVKASGFDPSKLLKDASEFSSVCFQFIQNNFEWIIFISAFANKSCESLIMVNWALILCIMKIEQLDHNCCQLDVPENLHHVLVILRIHRSCLIQFELLKECKGISKNRKNPLFACCERNSKKLELSTTWHMNLCINDTLTKLVEIFEEKLLPGSMICRLCSNNFQELLCTKKCHEFWWK
jgi:hypothetical protein